MNWSIIILAAGKGTRLKTTTPKPLVPILGTPLIQPILDLSSQFDFAKRIIVTSEYTQEIETIYSSELFTFVCTEPKGTADAVLQALPHITSDNILIAQSDDSFLYTQQLLCDLMKQHDTYQSDFTVGLAAITEEIEYRSGIWGPESQQLLGIRPE